MGDRGGVARVVQLAHDLPVEELLREIGGVQLEERGHQRGLGDALQAYHVIEDAG